MSTTAETHCDPHGTRMHPPALGTASDADSACELCGAATVEPQDHFCPACDVGIEAAFLDVQAGADLVIIAERVN